MENNERGLRAEEERRERTRGESVKRSLKRGKAERELLRFYHIDPPFPPNGT